ncbi:MAG TPA: septal ring lytic transglycosylase RlpA family protein [Terriglobales bacterium]|nr:septal ring lytic transglycosylase RlpA family protein [Terriglobales bacterium]
MERVYKTMLNTVALGALVSVSMAASAPTRSDHQNTSTSIPDQRTEVQKPKMTPRRAFQVGTASWYGKDFDGKPTASGEPYDMYELTAAHRTLPLGTWVKVTNLRNHRWVLVRINDRGPVPEDRIIDLSYSAAHMLKMSGRGIARVRLDVMNPPEKTSDVAFIESAQLRLPN